jgi:hypothetical protein
MSGVCLATRGYICQGKGPVITTGEPPDSQPEDLKPKITSRDTDRPVVVVETVPDLKPVIKPKRRRRMRRAA